MKKNNFKVIIFYSVLILLVILASTSLFNMSTGDQMKYSQILALFEKDQVKEFNVSAEGDLSIVTVDNKRIEYELQRIDFFREDVLPKLSFRLLTLFYLVFLSFTCSRTKATCSSINLFANSMVVILAISSGLLLGNSIK